MQLPSQAQTTHLEHNEVFAQIRGVRWLPGRQLNGGATEGPNVRRETVWPVLLAGRAIEGAHILLLFDDGSIFYIIPVYKCVYAIERLILLTVRWHCLPG